MDGNNTLAMRWRGALMGALVLAAAMLQGCGGGGQEPAGGESAAAGGTPAKEPFKVALVFDEGGLGDKSFNDAAHEGTERAAKELGIEFKMAEPERPADRVTFLERFSTTDAKLILCVGFLFTEEVRRVAKEHPDKLYACVDYSLAPGEVLPPNLATLNFREHEGSFLVGAIAALTSKSGTIGFVGGAEGPLIRKFEVGYAAGARHVRPDVQVKVAYAGVTGAAFSNPTKGKELALAMLGEGADVIFHAAGTTGFGVFNACRERGALAIGVDRDQSDPVEYPNIILTSMVKRTDNAVFDAIRSAAEGNFKAGPNFYGLADDGVGYVLNASNRTLIAPEIVEKVNALREQIIKGEIVVPSE